MIPGANLLNMAFGVIGRQTVQLARFISAGRTPSGYPLPVYAAPVDITGSFQPARMELVAQLGLDMTRKYALLYTSDGPIQCIDPDKSGDRITWGAETYEAQTKVDWKGQDGWEAVLFVRVIDA